MNFRFVLNALPFVMLLLIWPNLGFADGVKDVMIGHFSVGDLRGWKEKIFKKKTIYKLVSDDIGMIVRSKSVSAASAFYKNVSVNLDETPCLHWNWKVDGVLEGLDETTKSGDDYVARVYVVVSADMAFWNTRAVNYVWSGSQPLGASWPNAYTGNSINVTQESGVSKVGRWVHEVRNVKDDFARLVDKNIKQVDGVAIMTDTDDSQGTASASFGDIYFSKACG